MRNRQVIATDCDDLEIVVCDDGSRTLRKISTGVTWHSESGALAETQIVFLNNSDVFNRLMRRQRTRVLEIGFGTGLNFWTTASIASKASNLESDSTPFRLLDYVAVEPNRLSATLIDQLAHRELEACQPAFDQFHPQLVGAGVFQATAGSVAIRIIDNLAELASEDVGENRFDAIYHDPFSPEVAPELWSLELFRQLRQLLRGQGRLVTYCVKSEIQRRLREAGFLLEKRRGPPGGKREVMIAHRFEEAENQL